MATAMAGLPLYQLLFLPVLLVLPFAYLVLSARRRSGGLRLPPGPRALPVIGHLHHFLEYKLPPHHKLRDLARRHGALMLLRLGALPVVVASSANAAREVLKTHDVAFATRPVGPTARLVLADGAEGLIFAPYGEGWRQLRKVCTLELLSARRVRSFRAVREQEVRRLVRAVASTPAPRSVNLSRVISSYVADSAARSIIGSRFEDREAFLRLMERGMKLAAGPSLPDLFPSSRLAMLVSRTPRLMERQREEMMALMGTIIDEHQARRNGDADDEDLVDVLLRVQRDGELQLPLTTDNIKTVIADLFVAGSETSATTLQWAMSELVKNPGVMEKAQEEIRRVLEIEGEERVTEGHLSKLPYLHLVIKETLRLHPPAPLLLPRECRSQCRVAGYDVPEGTTVLVNAWAIGRDPSHWDSPEEFMPERFDQKNVDFKGVDFEYIPFGAGRRMCPGMAFGLANVELALASLLYHFDWQLPRVKGATVKLDMTEVMAVTARRRKDLLLFPVMRMPVTSRVS